MSGRKPKEGLERLEMQTEAGREPGASGKYAWSSVDRAMEFAEALTAVMMDQDQPSLSADERLTVELLRLQDVLKVLCEYTNTVAASLWKLKERSEHASLVTRLVAGRSETGPVPQDSIRQKDYVLSFERSPVNGILDKVRQSGIPAKRGMFDPIVLDKDELGPDATIVFSDAASTSDLGDRKLLVVPFGNLCSEKVRNGDLPNYILCLVCEGELEGLLQGRTLQAVISKLTSGVCALIDRRVARITENMSRVDLQHDTTGADLAIETVLLDVVPNYVRSEYLLRIAPRTEGGFEIKFARQGRGAKGSFSKRIDLSGNESVAQELGELCSTQMARRKLNPQDARIARRADAMVVPGSSIASFRSLLPDFDVRSAIVGKVHDRSGIEPDGYLLLINRTNDLSRVNSERGVVPDFFDWEDEVYLANICSVLDFISELFVSEESRMRGAHILAHELHAPTNFIYATVERLRDALSGRREMPPAMMGRELQDVLDTSDLQSALIDRLMIGLQSEPGKLPQKYRTRKVSFQHVSEKVARMVLPLCRKAKVQNSAIEFGSFPSLFMDERAVTQLFLNLTTNAIKYRDPASPASFSFIGYSELCSASELQSTNIPRHYLAVLSRQGVLDGHLMSFSDNGIGIPRALRERVFLPGTRAKSKSVQAQVGAGLGLSVVRAIVRDHYGEVWVESLKSPTQICVFLPDWLEDGRFLKKPEWQL